MTGEQQQIGGDRVGGGSIDGKHCEWCEDPATHSLPIYRKIKGGRPGAVVETGMFVFACDSHRDIATKSNPPREGTRK